MEGYGWRVTGAVVECLGEDSEDVRHERLVVRDPAQRTHQGTQPSFHDKDHVEPAETIIIFPYR